MSRHANQRNQRLMQSWRAEHPEAIAVCTLVLIQDGRRREFRPIELVDRSTLGDITYLCGSISILIDGREVMGEDYADDIWWWWAYWLNALEDLWHNRPHEVYGPSTPVRLKVTPLGPRVRIELGTRSAEAPRAKFVEKIAQAAIRFAEWAGDAALLKQAQSSIEGRPV